MRRMRRFSGTYESLCNLSFDSSNGRAACSTLKTDNTGQNTERTTSNCHWEDSCYLCLANKRINANLVMCFKILNSLVCINSSNFFSPSAVCHTKNNTTRCFIKGTPYSFCHNSLKWWSICTKFLAVVAEKNTNSKY